MQQKITLIARILLGLIFTIFGTAGLFNLMPAPDNLPPNMTAFMNGMMATGFFFPLLKISEIVCGLFLLSGYFVPLALIVLAPIVLNIFLVHAFMAPEGLPMALLIGLLEVYLAFFAKPYCDIILKLFNPKTRG